MNGETVLNTLAHNPRCIQAHKDVSVPYSHMASSPDPKPDSKDTTDGTKTEIAIAVDKPLGSDLSTGADVATTLSSLLSGTNTTLGTTGMGIFGTQVAASTPRATPTLAPLTMTGGIDSPPSVSAPQSPPLSSPLWRPFGPDLNTDSKLSEDTTQATCTTHVEADDVEPMVEDNDNKTRKVTFATASTPIVEAKNEGDVTSLEADSDKLSTPKKTPDPDVKSSDPATKAPEGEKNQEKPSDEKSTETDKPDSPLSSYLRDCCPSCGLYTHDDILGYDLLRATFRNWPCICTSILGFNPFPYIESKEPFPTPSSIQALDRFISNMFINCDSGLIIGITGTMTSEMNTALEKGVDIRPLLEADDDSLENMNESNVSMYVGLRYIRSVVRTLMLEHSRVKSSVADVQLSREGRNRSSQLQIRSKIVQQILK